MEAIMRAMASVKEEDILHDYRPLLVIYKDGTIHRFLGTLTVPPSVDSVTGVESKDVVISHETGVYVRLYKPQHVLGRVPVLVYFHGGGFCVETAASPVYHSYLNALSSKANVVVVSVDYRRAPEHPLPVAYDDSWAALEWVWKCGEPWVRDHADLSRVFLGGDSAGANIAHHMAKRVGKRPLNGFALDGLVLVHPYFWGKDRIGSELQKLNSSGNQSGSLMDRLWMLACPGTSCGADDPMINPRMDPELGELGAKKVMVCVAEEDYLRDRGFLYKEVLLKSGWKGTAHVVETMEENHVFYLMNPANPKAADLMDQIGAFLNS